MRTLAVVAAGVAGAALAVFMSGVQAENETFSSAQVKKGGEIYAQNCSPCHGPRMLDPQGAFDLRTFPRDDRSRYITSVTKGKNQMPPWGGLLSADDIEALWAYTLMGEK